MKQSLAFAGLALSCALISPSFAQTEQNTAPAFKEIPGEREFTGWMIARPVQPTDLIGKGVNQQEAETLHALGHGVMGGYAVRDFVTATDEYIFALPAGSDENSIARELMSTGAFQYVEPDWMLYPIATPNDGLLSYQWHHNANIMDSFGGWDIHTGNPSTVVAYCDTGVMTDHEDLLANRVEGYNAVDQQWENKGGNIGPVHYHGTSVTGCGSANGNNGVGVSGVGWNLGHRMMRVSNDSGGGAYNSVLNHAARTAIEAGDKVASVSYSGPDSSSNLTSATYIKGLGGLLFWAAGNDSRNLTYGNRDNDDIMIIGATNDADSRASFSAYGQYVDLMAPGEDVVSTYTSNTSSYAYVSGTSFACPIAAGLAGLIWSFDPSLTPDEVEDFLKNGCDDLGSAGVDNTYGYGRVNTNGSLTLADGGTGGPTPPVADFSADTTSGDAPLDVNFSDASSNSPTSWSWSFGDGGSSTAQNPSHTYTAAGTYTVSLTVSNADGSDTETKVDYITVTDGGGGVTGQGFIISRNADFSTDDRSFSIGETIYVKVWTDQVNHANMRQQWHQFKKGRTKFRSNMTNHGDGSWTATFDSSSINRTGNWTWKANIRDRSGVRYQPSATLSFSN